MIYQVRPGNTQRKSRNVKKTQRRKVNMLQCPSSLKQMNFKTECFSSLLVTIDTEVIIFNIWPVVNNNETQWRNSRAVALSTHARLRFNSSMSSLLEAFDYVLALNSEHICFFWSKLSSHLTIFWWYFYHMYKNYPWGLCNNYQEGGGAWKTRGGHYIELLPR